MAAPFGDHAAAAAAAATSEDGMDFADIGDEIDARLHEHLAEADTGVTAKPLPTLVTPSPQEVGEHNVSHLPCRQGCRHCVAGRGKADRHYTVTDDDHKLPTVHCDYCYMGEKPSVETMDERNLPTLVIKGGNTKHVDAFVVQSTGTQHVYFIKALANALESTGYFTILFTSDGEHSIIALKRTAVAELRNRGVQSDIQFEESAVGDSAQNAVIERSVWEVESLTRVLVHQAQ
jgi:hypothetical protein